MTYSYNEALKESTHYFGGDELAAKVFLDKYALKNKEGELLEQTPNDMHHRLASEFARIEAKKFKNPLSEDEIFKLFKGFNRIIPQGSPMYGIGNPYQIVSIGNCFVIPSPYDSYLGIMKTDTEITQISCRRGGVGFDVSTLRPNGAAVKNAAKTTSGTISFMKRFSNTVREVGQHGRRGASIQCLRVDHPDIVDFIHCKRDLKEITGSNISVKISDDFMKAVENNEVIPLTFNDKLYYTVFARKVWEDIVESAWLTGEPGLMFWDTVMRESTSKPHGFPEVASNPCGEQYLPAYASCRLICLNVYNYIKEPFTNYAQIDDEALMRDAMLMQRLADDMVDLEIECINRIIHKIENDPEPMDVKQPAIKMWRNIQNTAISDRRTGCGITGLADAFAALGFKYGSKQSIKTASSIMEIIAHGCYRSSIEMAEELGSFPNYNYDKDLESDFIKRIIKVHEDIENGLKKYGRRNMTLLTIAPTGSVSVLTQTSSGMEPVFQLVYKRRKKGNPGDTGFRSDFTDQSGDHWMEFEVHHDPLLDWCSSTGLTKISDGKYASEPITKSPWYGCCAQDIKWEDKLKIQAALQQYVDNSISNTYNLPEDISKEEVGKLYFAAWKAGAKGVTVYRQNSRTGVLVEEKKKDDRPKELPCDIHHITVQGKQYFVLVGIKDSHPYEVFAGKNGILPKTAKHGIIVKKRKNFYKLVVDDADETELCPITNAMSEMEEAISRLTSGLLRCGADMNFIVGQLEKVGETKEMTCFTRGVSRALKKYIPDGTKVEGEKCEECGSENLTREEGCKKCSCGWSKCS